MGQSKCSRSLTSTAVHLDCDPSLPSTFADVISSDPQVHPMGMLVVPISEMTQCPGAGGRVSMGVSLMRLLRPSDLPWVTELG